MDKEIEKNLVDVEKHFELLNEIWNRAVKYYNEQNYEKEIEEYKKALDLGCTENEKIEISVRMGNSYFNKGSYEEAIRIYKEVLRLNCTDEKKSIIYDSLGNSYLDKTDYEESISAWNESIKLECSDKLKIEKHKKISSSYYRLEKYEEAINELQKALNLNCSDELKVSIYNRIGIVYYKIGKYKESIIELQKALNLNCSDELKVNIYNGIGAVYYKIGKYKESINELQKILSLNCSDELKVNIYNGIGAAYYSIGKYKEAITELQKALNLNCSDESKVNIYNRIGAAYYIIGKYEETIKELQVALKLECSDELKVDCYNGIGTSYYMIGKYEESIKELQVALKLECSDELKADIYNKISCSYYMKKEYDKALKEWNKALKLNCSNELKRDIYDGIGSSYYMKKEYEESIKIYKKALELANEEDIKAIICFRLSKVYKELNNIEKYNNYLVKATDNKFYEYIERKNFNNDIQKNNEIKQKIYKLFNKIINLRDEMIYKGDKSVGHYTKIKTLKYLIKPNIKNDENNLKLDKARLRLNNVAYMNDPTEGEVFIELLLTKVIEDEKLKDAKEFIKNLYVTGSNTNREVLNRKSSVFLTSFSEAIDTSLPMWVQYSDDGQGCCITIKSSFFDKEEKSSLSDSFKVTKIKKSEKLVYTIGKNDIEGIRGLVQYNSSNDLELLTEFSDKPYYEKSKDNECYCLYRIQYLEHKDGRYYITEDKEKKFKDLLESLCDLREDIESNYDLKPIIQNILDQIRFLFKDKNYEHEKELRLIKFENNGKVKYTGENEGFIVPHVYIEMDKELEVEEVILGPKAKNPMEVATYLYYTDKVKQVSKSKIKYK
ncbi:tetratricopeptide repeat protein [Clostridium perfringens]